LGKMFGGLYWRCAGSELSDNCAFGVAGYMGA
jgi:hypothetical protein